MAYSLFVIPADLLLPGPARIAHDDAPPLVVLEEGDHEATLDGILVNADGIVAVGLFVDVALERCQILFLDSGALEAGFLDPFKAVLRQEVVDRGPGILAPQIKYY